MTYHNQIKNLQDKLDLARSNKEYNSINAKIIKLAKKYNSLNYKDEYIIIGYNVYGLMSKKNHRY